MRLNQVMQTAPISDMKRVQSDVLNMLPNGPVVLLQRSQPAAVMVDPTLWNAIAIELAQYRARAVANVRSQEINADPSILVPFTDEELAKRGLFDA